MKYLLPKAAQTPPYQPASPSGQRVLKETKRLHQAEQKNVGMKVCDQLCGKLDARNRLKLLWRFGDRDEGKARQEAPAEGEQNPVPSSHHCALFNLYNCVSRALCISLHFEFPAFCRLASQKLFETLPLLWSLQKRNPCSISMCPGRSVGSQCQGSHVKETWAIEMQRSMPWTWLGLGLVRQDYSSGEELLSQKPHNNHLCVVHSKYQLMTCSAGLTSQQRLS